MYGERKTRLHRTAREGDRFEIQAADKPKLIMLLTRAEQRSGLVEIEYWSEGAADEYELIRLRAGQGPYEHKLADYALSVCLAPSAFTQVKGGGQLPPRYVTLKFVAARETSIYHSKS